MLTVGQEVWISERLIANAGADFSGIRFPEIKPVYKMKIIGTDFWDTWPEYPNRKIVLGHTIFATKEEAVANTLKMISEELNSLNKRILELEQLSKDMLNGK